MNGKPTPPSEFDLPLSEAALSAARADDADERAALDLPPELGDDPRLALRRILGMFATGVTVITTREGDDVHGMTANAFMSVSLEPPLVLVAVDRRTAMHDLLHEGRRYGVSVLRETQRALSERYGSSANAHQPEPSFDVIRDTPLVEGALAHFVARVTDRYWGGDHSLFLGRVEYARYSDGTPLLFHGGRYERLGETG
jgi:flavin reductase (DIM6/NTAB) family NADH-FMN oxidoreductase RutF